MDGYIFPGIKQLFLPYFSHVSGNSSKMDFGIDLSGIDLSY